MYGNKSHEDWSPDKYRNVAYIVTYLSYYIRGFGLITGVNEHLQNITTNNYYSLTELHTPQKIWTLLNLLYSPAIAWWRISTMSSTSLIRFLPSGDNLTTNSLLQQCYL
jgi:hypothetical protein